MRDRRIVFGVGLVAITLMPVSAHHATHTVYDEGQEMVVEGTVGRVVHRNPHPLVDVVVESRAGTVRTWAVEFETVSQLVASANGLVLRPGDRITVCGNPGRDPGMYRLRMLKVTRPSDGRSLIQTIGAGQVPGQCGRP